ncbi:MAG: hypothetical protein PGN08_13810 [Sphingomonas taxi]
MVKWDGENVGQNFLTLSTDLLHYVPDVKFLDRAVDRFFHLQEDGQLLDGSWRKIPALPGLSGASLWTLGEPEGLWAPSKVLKIVAVQSSYSPGRWFRCVDWEAVRQIFARPEIGFSIPPAPPARGNLT